MSKQLIYFYLSALKLQTCQLLLVSCVTHIFDAKVHEHSISGVSLILALARSTHLHASRQQFKISPFSGVWGCIGSYLW